MYRVTVPLSFFYRTHSPPTKSAQVETSAEPLPLFIRSKWESVDPSSAAEEAVTSTRWEIFAGAAESDVSKPCNLTEEDVDGKPLDEFGAVGLGLVAYDDDDALSPAAPSPPPPPSASHSVSSASAAKSSSSISESRRALLREIEVKVVKYQDELEASRKSGDSSVTDEAIATQVQRYRDRLLDRLETDDAAGFTADRSPSTKKSKSSSGGGGGGGGTSKGRSSSNRGDSAAGSTSSSKRHKHKSSREHASQRDRSPPRSLRDRDQRLPPRRRSSSSDDDDDTDPDHSVPPSSKRPRPANWTEGGGGSSPGEEIEEGEASDDDSFSAHSSSIRRGRHRESGEPLELELVVRMDHAKVDTEVFKCILICAPGICPILYILVASFLLQISGFESSLAAISFSHSLAYPSPILRCVLVQSQKIMCKRLFIAADATRLVTAAKPCPKDYQFYAYFALFMREHLL
ncbi:unnamed protein product [Schistocephalus solidus]|uniref:CWF21 domain-containing protein n=1 Tax=Schistocephalus solidus TaxID=70667 RepID=A0A3P7CTZ9_SCHSO|nr:unnamed protein product [Schistocephalus solidus]